MRLNGWSIKMKLQQFLQDVILIFFVSKINISINKDDIWLPAGVYICFHTGIWEENSWA